MNDLKSGLKITLEKALDKTKLVQVQVTVQGKNGPFLRMQWKNPADVKPTDKVIGNQDVLDKYKKEQAKKQSLQTVSKNNFKQSVFDNLKADKDKRKDAMDYAKLSGVTWTEHSNPNINWMRCCMAVNKLNDVTVSVQTSKKLDVSGISGTWDNLDKKSKMAELLKNNSKQELMEFAKENGITWKEDASSEGINWMRASMAIQKYIEGKSLLEISANTSSNSSSTKEQKKEISSEIDIPANATVREKTLIGLINKITDEDDIELFKSTGMIAEDDDSKAFLKTKLLPRYNEWKKGAAAKSNTSRRSTSYASDRDFGKDSAKGIGSAFKGIPQKLMAKGISTMRSEMSIVPMLYPRDCISPLVGINQPYSIRGKVHNYSDFTAANMLRELNKAYSTYSDDSTTDSDKMNHRYNSTESYTFDKDKDGFCTVLSHIKSKLPALSSDCDRMSSVYLDMMNIADGNYKTLNEILSTYDYSRIEYSVNSFKTKSERNTKIVKALRDLGLNDGEILATIRRNRWGDVTNFKLANSDETVKVDNSGNTKTVNLKEIVGKDSNGNYLVDSSYVLDSEYNFENFYLKPGNNGLTKNDNEEYESIKNITFDKFKKIQSKSLELMGMKIVKNDTTTGTASDFDLLSIPDSISYYTMRNKMGADYDYIPDPNVSKNIDVVIANLASIRCNYNVKKTIQSSTSYDCTPSQANKNGNDYSGNFNWFNSDNSASGRIHYWDNSTTRMNSSQVNSTIKSQLDSVPVVTPEFLDNLSKFIEEKGSESYSFCPSATDVEKRLTKAQSYDVYSEDCVQGFKGTPIYDLIVEQLKDVSNYCPQMKTARYNTTEKLHKYVDDKLDFTPFDFSTLKANISQNSSPSTPQIPAEKLKGLRQELFKAVHCSIKTCDSNTNSSNETNVKHNWDKGKRNASGNRLYGSISGVFHGSYEIKNSVQEEKFRENCKKLGETPKTYFHGTNHSGACGIIGVDGHFIVPKDHADAAKKGLKYAGGMLGAGVYLADMAGKSAGYFGTWGSGYNKEGCLLVCEAILGKHYTASNYSGSSAPSSYDSVSMRAGTNTGRTILRADEWCVRNPDFVFPKYIMDMEVKNRV